MFNERPGSASAESLRDPRLRSTLRSLPVFVALLFLLGASVFFTFPALAEDQKSLPPEDDNLVTPGQIRQSYFKRYPYAADAARRDQVSDGESADGGSESWEAYSLVLQPCVGGYLDTLNALDDALNGLDNQLSSQLQQQLKYEPDPQRRSCLKAQIDQLNQQTGQIGQLNRQDLAGQNQQLNHLTQVSSQCPEVINNPGYTQIQQVQSQINQLNGMLNTLDLSSISTETDHKACCFKNFQDKDWPPPPLLHYYYIQLPQQASVQLPTQRDSEALHTGLIKTYGLPMSDTQFEIIDRNNRQRLLEHIFDPERWMWVQLTLGHLGTAAVANSLGGAAEAGFESAVSTIDSTLINVASEKSAEDISSGAGGGRSLAQAIHIVQQMYRSVFVPMAILFLLPGAVLTQAKGLISNAFLGGGEDSSSPFEGILRSLIALFLIPATQLIVSYAIDTGNTLAAAVRDPQQKWIQAEALVKWGKEQTFVPEKDHFKNGIFPGDSAASSSVGQAPVSGGGGGHTPVASNPGVGTASNRSSSGQPAGASASSSPGRQRSSALSVGLARSAGLRPNNPVVQLMDTLLGFLFGGQRSGDQQDAHGLAPGQGQGKAAGELEQSVVQEDQLWLSGTMQAGFNGLAYLMSSAITVLTAYQVVFMCYLFLLGPIAACFFAWPTGIGSLFRPVFANWLNAVIVLALWRFWWCVILAVMTQRIVYLHPNPGAASEMMVFSCFLALLLYIPFQPFSFNPGPIVSSILDKAGQGGGAGKATGGGGGAAGEPTPAESTMPSASARSPGPNRAMQELATLSSGWQSSLFAPARAAAGSDRGESHPARMAVAGRPSLPSAAYKINAATGSTAGQPPLAARELSAIISNPAAVALPPALSATAVPDRENQAASILKTEHGADAIAAVSPGETPPLSPSRSAGGQIRYVINTGDLDLARTGIREWQKLTPTLNSTGWPGANNPQHGGTTESPADRNSVHPASGNATQSDSKGSTRGWRPVAEAASDTGSGSRSNVAAGGSLPVSLPGTAATHWSGSTPPAPASINPIPAAPIAPPPAPDRRTSPPPRQMPVADAPVNPQITDSGWEKPRSQAGEE